MACSSLPATSNAHALATVMWWYRAGDRAALVTAASGVDDVVHWINAFFGLQGDERIRKIKCHKIARWVMDQYEVERRLSPISDEEMEAKVRELMPVDWERYEGR